MVESENDEDCLRLLVKNRLTERDGHGTLRLDPTRAIHKCELRFLMASCQDLSRWRHRLSIAASRDRVGAVLLLTDGDGPKRIDAPAYRKINGGSPAFCARSVGLWLARDAEEHLGHRGVSVGVAIACPEYENWLNAALLPEGDERLSRLEAGTDAKRLLKQLVDRPIAHYTESNDQFRLTDEVRDWSLVRDRSRSFRHLEATIDRLLGAARAGTTCWVPDAGGAETP